MDRAAIPTFASDTTFHVVVESPHAAWLHVGRRRTGQRLFFEGMSA
jgi:hypothetical protein